MFVCIGLKTKDWTMQRKTITRTKRVKRKKSKQFACTNKVRWVCCGKGKGALCHKETWLRESKKRAPIFIISVLKASVLANVARDSKKFVVFLFPTSTSCCYANEFSLSLEAKKINKFLEFLLLFQMALMHTLYKIFIGCWRWIIADQSLLSHLLHVFGFVFHFTYAHVHSMMRIAKKHIERQSISFYTVCR